MRISIIIFTRPIQNNRYCLIRICSLPHTVPCWMFRENACSFRIRICHIAQPDCVYRRSWSEQTRQLFHISKQWQLLNYTHLLDRAISNNGKNCMDLCESWIIAVNFFSSKNKWKKIPRKTWACWNDLLKISYFYWERENKSSSIADNYFE